MKVREGRFLARRVQSIEQLAVDTYTLGRNQRGHGGHVVGGLILRGVLLVIGRRGWERDTRIDEWPTVSVPADRIPAKDIPRLSLDAQVVGSVLGDQATIESCRTGATICNFLCSCERSVKLAKRSALILAFANIWINELVKESQTSSSSTNVSYEIIW